VEITNDIKLGIEQAIEYEKGNLEAREETLTEIRCVLADSQLKMIEAAASVRGAATEKFIVELALAHLNGNAATVIEQLRKETAMWKDNTEEAEEQLARTRVALEQANDKIKRLENIINRNSED
jgi:uncharacterized protein (DUF1778 family)